MCRHFIEPFALVEVQVRANLVTANRVMLRLNLHPRSLAPKFANLAPWRAQLFERLYQQITAPVDPVLVDFLEELKAYPVPERGASLHLEGEHAGVVCPSSSQRRQTC